MSSSNPRLSEDSLPFPLTDSDRKAIASAVNRDLLRCTTVLNTAGSNDERLLGKALEHANSALEIATTFQQSTLRAKVQLVRGHCFRDLGSWPEAYRCFKEAAALAEIADGTSPAVVECLVQMKENGIPRPSEEDDPSQQGPGQLEGVTDIANMHIIRDATGLIVDIQQRKPALRSMKGKSFIIERPN